MLEAEDKDAAVSDPEELRARAASIFRHLRGEETDEHSQSDPGAGSEPPDGSRAAPPSPDPTEAPSAEEPTLGEAADRAAGAGAGPPEAELVPPHDPVDATMDPAVGRDDAQPDGVEAANAVEPVTVSPPDGSVAARTTAEDGEAEAPPASATHDDESALLATSEATTLPSEEAGEHVAGALPDQYSGAGEPPSEVPDGAEARSVEQAAADQAGTDQAGTEEAGAEQAGAEQAAVQQAGVEQAAHETQSYEAQIREPDAPKAAAQPSVDAEEEAPGLDGEPSGGTTTSTRHDTGVAVEWAWDEGDPRIPPLAAEEQSSLFEDGAGAESGYPLPAAEELGAPEDDAWLDEAFGVGPTLRANAAPAGSGSTPSPSASEAGPAPATPAVTRTSDDSGPLTEPAPAPLGDPSPSLTEDAAAWIAPEAPQPPPAASEDVPGASVPVQAPGDALAGESPAPPWALRQPAVADPQQVEQATWAATRLKLADLDLPALPGDQAASSGAADDTPGRDSRHPGSRRPLPRVMAIANQKGGVGKTTTAVNLGAGLAELGYRVLVIDLDPQGNASTGLGVNSRNLEASVYDVILHDVPMEDVIEPTTLRNLFVVPATIDLAGAEIELVPAFSRELRLRRAVESVADDFDYMIIDCPPSLGLLTVNGLAAASEVVVPIQCEYYALEGLGQLLRNVNLVQSNLNHALEVSTIVLTMYDARTRLAEQVVDEVRQHFGARVCRNVVPRTVRLSEAPSFGQPIIVFDPSSRGAIAYRELAKEVSGGAPQRIG